VVGEIAHVCHLLEHGVGALERLDPLGKDVVAFRGDTGGRDIAWSTFIHSTGRCHTDLSLVGGLSNFRGRNQSLLHVDRSPDTHHSSVHAGGVFHGRKSGFQTSCQGVSGFCRTISRRTSHCYRDGLCFLPRSPEVLE